MTEAEKTEKKRKKAENDAKIYAKNKAERDENETEEEKAERLRQRREYEHKRIAEIIANETEEEKKERRRKKNESAAKKVKCEICDIEIRRDSMSDHIKSKKHLKNLEKNLMANVD